LCIIIYYYQVPNKISLSIMHHYYNILFSILIFHNIEIIQVNSHQDTSRYIYASRSGLKPRIILYHHTCYATHI
jgi:hypothetical protein